MRFMGKLQLVKVVALMADIAAFISSKDTTGIVQNTGRNRLNKAYWDFNQYIDIVLLFSHGMSFLLIVFNRIRYEIS
jgi:hypothetical protein